MEAKKAVISLSGGLDSTMLLMYYLSKGYDVKAYSFEYGQKHNVELKKVKKNIKFLQNKGFNVTHQIINLTDVFSDSNSSLHKGGGDIPHSKYDSETQKSTVIEQRNVIFSAIVYGKALSWANKTQENVIISLGIHSNDHSIYPDCRPESQEMAKELYRISNWGSERVDYEAPFVNIDKVGVLKMGLDSMHSLNMSNKDIKTIIKNTHSCYDVDKDGYSCGKCGTCQERLYAFAMNGIKDPVKYNLSNDELDDIYDNFKKNGL